VQTLPHPSLRWRRFDDGLVCLVEASCETHGLPAVLAPLLAGPACIFPIDEPDCLELLSDGGWRLSRSALDELLRLQVLVPADPS
jgi:hypothetical protein